MVFTPQQQQALLQLLEQSATSKIVNPQDLQILRNDMRRTINANLEVMKNLLAEANHAVRSDIVDTINQCLQQKSNLFDVDDIKAARSNLGLGTLATLNQLPPEQLPIASTTRAGIVQLTSVTDSESETIAASAKALKTVIDHLALYAPVGIPQPWPKATLPAGWLKCDGAPFDQECFPLLAIAYPNGVLPDLRGEFIRGLDNGRNVDHPRQVLSTQQDTMQKIWAQWTVDDQTVVSNFPPKGAFYCKNQGEVNYDAASNLNTYYAQQGYFDSSRVTRTSDETRPRNVAFLYIVRAA